MKKTTVASVCLALLCGSSWADEGEEPRTVEMFEAARPADIEQPDYPSMEIRKGEEGWVVVNYMVDTDGKVFEPTVVSSTGSKRFEREALSALKKSKFTPATLNGEPVESSGYFRYIFSLEGSRVGASRNFVANYKKFASAMVDGNKAVADEYMDKMSEAGTKNHYESAYLAYAKSIYAAAYGTPIEQMHHLWKALQYQSQYDDGTEFLPKELVSQARRQQFLLELQNKYYAEALKTYRLIKEKEDPQVVEQLKDVVKQLLDLKTNDVAYALQSTTNDDGYWSVNLHKRGFYVDNKGSKMDEIKLRCSKKYVYFSFVEGNQYQIPASWGQCSLELLGAANSDFELVQF